MEERRTDIRVERRRPPDRGTPRTASGQRRSAPRPGTPRQNVPAARRVPDAGAQRRAREPSLQTSGRPRHKSGAGAHVRRKRKKRFRPAGFLLSLALLLVLGVVVTTLLTRGRDAIATAAPGITKPQETGAAQAGPPYTIVIDAGHGGIDLGTDSGYVIEVEMVEATTDALVALLEQDGNFTPMRTRQNGEGMSIADRAAVANDNGAALFLSIHGNYDETLTASGCECYAQTPGRATNEDSLRFANAIVSAMRENGAEIRGQSGVRYAYYEPNGDGTYNKVIAEASDTTVRSELTFGVLEKNESPAVLVEQCFLSDAADCAAWASAEGCEKAARAYYQAICAYFGVEPSVVT